MSLLCCHGGPMDGAWVQRASILSGYYESQVVSVMQTIEVAPFDARDWINEWTLRDGQYMVRYRSEGDRLVYESCRLVRHGR